MCTASHAEESLIGIWAYNSKNLVLEYNIENIAEDGTVEGTVCTVRHGRTIWGTRLEGVAHATPEGGRIQIDGGGAKHNVRRIGENALLAQIWGPDETRTDPAWILDLARGEKTRCAHRFRNARTADTTEKGKPDSIIGEWSKVRRNGSSAELAIESIDGRHVQGRLCTRKASGSIYLLDLYKGGPNEAKYDDRTEKVQVVQKMSGDRRRVIEFEQRSEVWITGTTQVQGEPDGEPEVNNMLRGRSPQGCLARTNARVRAMTGTWTNRSNKAGQVALRIDEDRGGARVRGLICAKHSGGRVTATWFPDRHGGAEAAVRTNEDEIEIFETTGDWETTHMLRTEPNQPNRVLYQYVRDGDAEGESAGETKLRRTSKKTCAQALRTPAGDDNAPASGEAGHGLLGEWSGTNRATETVTEVRIERIKGNDRAVGLICQRTGPNSIRYWNLNHRRIKARRQNDSTIRWERKKRTHAVENDTHESLVLSESAGQELLAHILRVKGAKTETTVMRRGRASEGCLAYIARQRQ